MTDCLLIIGLGRAGQRHARNALALGCEVVGYDPNINLPDLRFPDLPEKVIWRNWDDLASVPPKVEYTYNSVRLFESLGAAISVHPVGVIIATPPETHYAMIGTVLDYGISTLTEKPLCTSVVDAGLLVSFGGHPIRVAYQLRHIPYLKRIKAQAYNLHGAWFHFASQCWCSNTYEADFLLEVSHEFDLACWLFGKPKEAKAYRLGPQQWDISIQFDKCQQCTFTLDGTAPGYSREIGFHGYGMNGQSKWIFDKAENDAAYAEELRSFLRFVHGKETDEDRQTMATGEDGWWALRCVEAVKRSAESGKWEAV